MNCDLAFDLMTDPQGQGSQALQRHLSACPRCRQMQQTLSPALDWLTEAGTVEDVSLQPAARDAGGCIPRSATAESLDVAREAAATLSARSGPGPSSYGRLPRVALRCATALGIGGLLALALIPPARPLEPSRDAEGCRRQEAARDSARSAAQLRELIASCAACHRSDRAAPTPDRRTGAFDFLLPPATAGLWREIMIAAASSATPDRWAHSDRRICPG